MITVCEECTKSSCSTMSGDPKLNICGKMEPSTKVLKKVGILQIKQNVQKLKQQSWWESRPNPWDPTQILVCYAQIRGHPAQILLFKQQ